MHMLDWFNNLTYQALMLLSQAGVSTQANRGSVLHYFMYRTPQRQCGPDAEAPIVVTHVAAYAPQGQVHGAHLACEPNCSRLQEPLETRVYSK